MDLDVFICQSIQISPYRISKPNKMAEDHSQKSMEDPVSISEPQLLKPMPDAHPDTAHTISVV